MKKMQVVAVLVMVLALFLPMTEGAAQSPALPEAPRELQPLWQEGHERNKIVVISDLHLGIRDDYTETLANRPRLVEFLQRLQKTGDVRELVIAGDFLDAWFLPVYYPAYTDERQFYQQVIANNQEVITALNQVADKGINLVYVIGNHDMTLSAPVLQDAIPKIKQVRDAKGLGAYYTGNRKEIVIEHGHRYDVFSAPDTVTNAELCGNKDTIFPAGYFYARYAATWVLEGRPHVAKQLPVVTSIPAQTDQDQYGAYAYYAFLKKVSERMTPREDLAKKIFDVRIAGFNDAYTYLDFYPSQQADGTISAPVLFRNIQRTWGQRQELNKVKVKNTFLEAVAGATSWDYYAKQARTQYLANPKEKVEVVVFGHTHVPVLQEQGRDAYYVNSGTWVDHNTDYPEATRTFVVITSGPRDKVEMYSYEESGRLRDIREQVKKD